MRLWIDDVRPAPEGYIWCKSVNESKQLIEELEGQQQHLHDMAFKFLHSGKLSDYHIAMKMCGRRNIEVIDLDYDAGDYVRDGGDYIHILGWLEETGRNYPIHIHSMNPVGVENMRRIIKRNGWKEVF
jgi:hypothetical protein